MTEAATPSARTRLIALLGDPISHSLSPRLHNAAFAAEQLDAVYLALRCNPSDCERLLIGITRAGGGGNVTLPHKELAARVIERPTAAVTRTGACNTFWLENGEVCGDNTDVAGFRETLRNFIGSVAGARVVLIGAGGAARAVVTALADEKVDRIDVITRTPARIASLQAIVDQTPTQIAPSAVPLQGTYDLAINATPLGLHENDAFPLPIEQLRNCAAVLDLVYSREGTRWSNAATQAGIRAIDGKEMLIRQAGASFERWFQRTAPIDEMRRALEG